MDRSNVAAISVATLTSGWVEKGCKLAREHVKGWVTGRAGGVVDRCTPFMSM